MTRYYIRLDTSSTERQSDFDPLLSALTSQAPATSATIYRFDAGAGEFTAAASRASKKRSIGSISYSIRPCRCVAIQRSARMAPSVTTARTTSSIPSTGLNRVPGLTKVATIARVSY